MTGDEPALFPHPRGEQQTLSLFGDEDDQRPPLDVPQTFTAATSYQVRDELEELIGRDLLGPWDGEDEQFRPGAMGPRERYLVGMLGPKQRPRPGETLTLGVDAASVNLFDPATEQRI